MSDFFRKISDTLFRFGSKRRAPAVTERRRSPRFICNAPVLWEVGRCQGEGQLREVSFSGLRLRTNRAFVSGQHIRIRPLTESDAAPLSCDVAIGTVVYSRSRSEGFEIGVELINPERISRFAWMGQLTKPDRSQAVPRMTAEMSKPGLRLVHGGGDEHFIGDLLRPECKKKIQKNKGNE